MAMIVHYFVTTQNKDAHLNSTTVLTDARNFNQSERNKYCVYCGNIKTGKFCSKCGKSETEENQPESSYSP
jgi:hypothetical protein